MRDETLGMRAGDDDRADTLVGLGTLHERAQVGVDLRAELAARATEQAGDEHAAVLLNVNAKAVGGADDQFEELSGGEHEEQRSL